MQTVSQHSPIIKAYKQLLPHDIPNPEMISISQPAKYEGALTRRGWLLDVESRNGIVTHTRVILMERMGAVSQHFYSANTHAMSSLFTKTTHILPVFKAQPNLRHIFT